MPSTTGPSTRNAATTLDRYFTLSDTAGHSQTDFEELIGLFAPDAVLEPATGPSVRGAAQIRAFFRTFLDRNAESRHLWRTRVDDSEPGTVTVEWAVAVRRSADGLAAMTGTDVAALAPDGRIARLRVAMEGRRP